MLTNQKCVDKCTMQASCTSSGPINQQADNIFVFIRQVAPIFPGIPNDSKTAIN